MVPRRTSIAYDLAQKLRAMLAYACHCSAFLCKFEHRCIAMLSRHISHCAPKSEVFTAYPRRSIIKQSMSIDGGTDRDIHTLALLQDSQRRLVIGGEKVLQKPEHCLKDERLSMRGARISCPRLAKSYPQSSLNNVRGSSRRPFTKPPL